MPEEKGPLGMIWTILMLVHTLIALVLPLRCPNLV